MADDFSDVPVRDYSPTAPSWWNSLRTAGIKLQNMFGTGYVSPTEFTIVNNQSSVADVTGLAFAGASVRSFEARVQIYRNSTGGGATELAAACTLRGVYKSTAGTWELTVHSTSGDMIEDFGPGGILFSITAAGQVQYTSHNMSGTGATSKMTFKADVMGV